MTYLSDSLLLTFLMKWWDYVVLRECESFLSVQRDSLNRTQRQSPRRRRWCTQGVRLGEDDIVDIIRLLVVVLLNYVFPHWTIFLSPAVVEVKCSPQSVFGVFQPKITKETFHLTQNCECAMPILGTQFNWRTKKSGHPGIRRGCKKKLKTYIQHKVKNWSTYFLLLEIIVGCLVPAGPTAQ